MACDHRKGVAIPWSIVGLFLVVRQIMSIGLDSSASTLMPVSFGAGSLFLVLAIDRGTSAIDHPVRRRIYEHLARLPGDHFQSIVRSLQLGHGTASHHLSVLVDRGWLSLEKRSGRARYFPRGLESAPERNRLFLWHWTYRDPRIRVLLAVVVLDEAGPSAVGRQLGISRQLAAYHLGRLVESRLVRREGGRYRPVRSAAIDILQALPGEPRRPRDLSEIARRIARSGQSER